MPISTACPSCKKKFKVAEHLAGKKVNCPACKVVVPIPAAVAVPDDLQIEMPSAPKPQEDELALSIPGQDAGPQADLIRCPACGKDVEDGAVMCVSCGYNFQTKKSVKGHQFTMTKPGKIYIGTMISGFFFFALVCAGGYAVYWAFTKGDITKRFRDINDPEAKKKAEEEANQPTTVTTAPAVPTESMLVIVNERFPRLSVFRDGVRVGLVEKGKTEKIALPPADSKKSSKLSFEIKPEDQPRGVQLLPLVRDALANGTAFEGTTSEGLRLVFAGPSVDLVPKPGEVLANVASGSGDLDKTTGTGKFKILIYKNNMIKPLDQAQPLRLNWKTGDAGKVELSWLDQDCVVENDGKQLYVPAVPPFKTERIKLVFKDGKVDVAP